MSQLNTPKQFTYVQQLVQSMIAAAPSLAASIGSLWLPNSSAAYAFFSIHLCIGLGIIAYMNLINHANAEDYKKALIVVFTVVFLPGAFIAILIRLQVGVSYKFHMTDLAGMVKDSRAAADENTGKIIDGVIAKFDKKGNLSLGHGWKGMREVQQLKKEFSGRLSGDAFRKLMCQRLGKDTADKVLHSSLLSMTPYKAFAKDGEPCP